MRDDKEPSLTRMARITYSRGCQGLCTLRMGSGDDLPHLAKDVHLFATMEQAQAYRARLEMQYAILNDPRVDKVRIFAVQSSTPLRAGLHKDTPPGEIDPTSIVLGKDNFASFWDGPGEAFWEWMDHGWRSDPSASSNAFIYLNPKLPKFKTTVYGVIIGTGPYLPDHTPNIGF